MNGYKLIPTDKSGVETLRKVYLSSLSEFQELYLEIMIQESYFYLLELENESAGYAIINSEAILVEFFLVDKYLAESTELFKLVISGLSVKQVYCKSFDNLLLHACLMQGWSYKIHGLLFRDYCEKEVGLSAGLSMRQATLADIPMLLNQSEDIHELFETSKQLNQFIVGKNVFLFSIRGQMVGCGMIIRVHPDWSNHDLGVWVNPEFRGRELGAQIIRLLRKYSLERDWKPTCGCAFGNIASRKTLEKSGYVCKYSLLDFAVK